MKLKSLIKGITAILLLATGVICIYGTMTGNTLDWTYSLIGGVMILVSIIIMVQFVKGENHDE